MRLYRFMSASNGLLSIRDRRLRVGRIEELNDDFEFIGVALDLKEERVALRETRKQLSRANGVICMSKTWESPLMWAHYGDSHKGIALGFDVPESTFQEVEYVPERPTLESMGLRGVGDLTEVQMARLIKLKAKGWEYEQEHRAFVGLREPVTIDGKVHYFLNFGPELVLREVIVGSRFAIQRQDVVSVIGNLPDVDLFMARGDFNEFKVVRQRQESMWR